LHVVENQAREMPMMTGGCPAPAHIQLAERISWMASAHDLPAFDRYSPPK
jgi:hypothetical protein